MHGVRASADRQLVQGRAGRHYAYYHCPPKGRAVNVSKTTLEGQFVEPLAELQPSPGFIAS